MKDKKSRAGTKAKIKASRERERRVVSAFFLALVLLVVVVSAYFTYRFLTQSDNQASNSSSSQARAAIVDHLSLSFPNQTFVEAATTILESAGYAVDYYPGEEVTVGLYRRLPTYGYGVLIMRVHATSHKILHGQPVVTPAVLFTSELYDTGKYVSEQLTDHVFRVTYNTSDLKEYFAVGCSFVAHRMDGRFEDAAVIMMGCEGLVNTEMGEAFVSKGAKVYISWNGGVLANHTDQATTCLLRNLVTKKSTVEQAVTDTMNKVGTDPIFNSALAYYPQEAGEQKIEN